MSDDVKEEVAEHDVVDEAESSFDEDDDIDAKGDTQTPEKKGDSDEDESDTAGDEEDDKGDKEEADDKDESEKKDEKELSAKERADMLADQRLEGLLETQDREESDEPEEKPEDESKDKPRISKERLAKHLSLLSIDELPDSEIEVNGETINLAEYREEYPEDFNVAVIIASEIAEKQIKERIDKGEFVKKSALEDITSVMEADLDRTLKTRAFSEWSKMALDEKTSKALAKGSLKLKSQAVRAFRENEDFITEVSMKHSDVREIRASKGFRNWLAEQPRKIRALVATNDAESAITVLDYYKEDLAAKKVKEVDKDAKGRKDRHDDIHSESMRSHKSKKKTGNDVNMDDAIAAFEEDDDDD